MVRRIAVVLSVVVLRSAATAQDWQDYQDPFGTFTVSCPAGWKVKQSRPGEVEVKESDHTWVRIAMLATGRGEGATAHEEVLSYMGSFPAVPKVRDFAQLSLHPDRAVWTYVLPESQEGKLKGLLAVEVDGILHFGVAYQSAFDKWFQKSRTFQRIVSSLRFGEFKIPDWIYGGDRGPLPGIVKSKLRRCWSTDETGTPSAEVPDGWDGKEGDRRLEFSQTAGPARMVWQVSELTGEKVSPEKLVADAVGAKAIDAEGVEEIKTTSARLFPAPKSRMVEPLFLGVGGRLRLPPPPPDDDEFYAPVNRMSFTFEDQGGVEHRGYALVVLWWTKKKPQPYSAQVFVCWTVRDEFLRMIPAMEQISISMSGPFGTWEGASCRRDALTLMSKRNED